MAPTLPSTYRQYSFISMPDIEPSLSWLVYRPVARAGPALEDPGGNNHGQAGGLTRAAPSAVTDLAAPESPTARQTSFAALSPSRARPGECPQR